MDPKDYATIKRLVRKHVAGRLGLVLRYMEEDDLTNTVVLLLMERKTFERYTEIRDRESFIFFAVKCAIIDIIRRNSRRNEVSLDMVGSEEGSEGSGIWIDIIASTPDNIPHYMLLREVLQVVKARSKDLSEPIEVPILGAVPFSLLSVFILHLHEFSHIDIAAMFKQDRQRVARLIEKAKLFLIQAGQLPKPALAL